MHTTITDWLAGLDCGHIFSWSGLWTHLQLVWTVDTSSAGLDCGHISSWSGLWTHL